MRVKYKEPLRPPKKYKKIEKREKDIKREKGATLLFLLKDPH